MNIIFPVETPSRELIYKSQLAARFASSGHTCYLVLKSYVFDLIDDISPCIYFDKGFHGGVSEEIHRKVKAKGGKVVSLDEEGAVDFQDFSTLENRYTDFLFQSANIVFMWGQRQYSTFQKRSPSFDANKVIVSGHPRFENLKEKAQKTLSKEIEIIRKTYDQIILVSLNCGFGNNIKGDAFVSENYGPRVKHLNAIMSYDKLKVIEYIKLVKQLCRIGGFTVVVRPHPEESHAPYLQGLKQEIQDGFCVVSSDYSVLAWNEVASFIIHPDCTSAIEAILQGKRPISFLPEHPLKIFTHIPVISSYALNDIGKIVELVSERKEIPEGDILELKDFFKINNSSEQTIVEAVEECGLKSFQSKISFMMRLKFFLKGIWGGVTSKRNKFTAQKQKGFNKQAILRSIGASNFSEEVTLKEVAYRGCYVIQGSRGSK